MATKEALLHALSPIARVVAELDLNDTAGSEARLAASVSPEALEELGRALSHAFEEGWLAPRAGGEGVFFGRLSRPSLETFDLSIDVVEMEGPAAAHTHPRGEVSLCFARSGAPRFDGREPGFVVLPPGSTHVPTVEGGRMLIVYFLPGGAVEWN